MVWLLDAAHSFHLSPRYYYYTAILFLTRVDSSSSKVARASGINLLKGSNEREAVCTLITLPDLFSIFRVWASLIGSICFPFSRSDYDPGTTGFSDISRGYAFALLLLLSVPPLVSLFSAISILRFVTGSARYPDRYRLRRYENRTRSRTRLLSSQHLFLPFQLFPLAKRFDYR